MEDMNPCTTFIIGWVDRMSTKHGGVVRISGYDKKMDWGQALMYARYGYRWEDLNIQDPDEKDVELAKSWEESLPEYINLSKK